MPEPSEVCGCEGCLLESFLISPYEILFPDLDRLSSKGLMEYLISEENNILDLGHLNQTHDMGQPLNHYFINSSHNTYLTGT